VAPVDIGLEIAALSCGILSGGGKFIAHQLALKAKKHDEIRVLADSKLNTIADFVSTALIDGEISDQEFKLVLAEMSKCRQMKKEIREGYKKHMLQLNWTRRQITLSLSRVEKRRWQARAVARILFQPRQRGKPGVWWRSSQRGLGTELLVRGTESFSVVGCSKEIQNRP